MQTSSHVEKDNWYDLGSEQQIINIRPKGTYKETVKPHIPADIYKPCNHNHQGCPIDNQPLPCNHCPINEIVNDEETDENITDDSTTYGVSENVDNLENNDLGDEVKTVVKKTTKKAAAKKTTRKPATRKTVKKTEK